MDTTGLSEVSTQTLYLQTRIVHMRTIKGTPLCLVGSPHCVAIWLRITSLSEIIHPAILAASRSRRARIPSTEEQVLSMIPVLSVIVCRRRYLVHHSLQLVMVILRRVYRVGVKRVEVVSLVGGGVQLAVQQARGQDGVQ